MSTGKPFLRALTYGTFDLFHVGHVRLLRRIFDLSDQLYVGVSTDDFNAVKGKKAVNTYKARAEVVGACRYVHEVFPENSWEQKHEDLRRLSIGLLAMGDDWAGHFDELNTVAKVLYLPRTPAVSTSEIIEWIQDY
jgi:glycerol-3-phosphate cytidylyltransferase